MEERANLSKYFTLPTKFSFPQVVCILSYVMSFISKARKNQRMNGEFLFEGKQRFSAFHSEIRVTDQDSSSDATSVEVSLVSCGLGFPGHGNLITLVTSDLSMDDKELYMKTQLTRAADVSNLEVECSRYVNLALLYLYRKASCEIKHFLKKEIWTKLSFEYEGKGRLLDSMNFQETGELRHLTLEALGIRTRLPLIERFSPLAYSIAEYVHWNVARHRGVETCTSILGEN